MYPSLPAHYVFHPTHLSLSHHGPLLTRICAPLSIRLCPHRSRRLHREPTRNPRRVRGPRCILRAPDPNAGRIAASRNNLLSTGPITGPDFPLGSFLASPRRIAPGEQNKFPSPNGHSKNWDRVPGRGENLSPRRETPNE